MDSNNKADVTIKTFGRIYKMSVNEAKTAILNNKTALGIEFGSTRIKAVLVDDKYNPIASGSYDWENRYENGVWIFLLFLPFPQPV